MLGMNKPPSETNNFQWDYVATFNLVNFQIVSFFNGKVEEMKTDMFPACDTTRQPLLQLRYLQQTKNEDSHD